jgi:hypothetical protein
MPAFPCLTPSYSDNYINEYCRKGFWFCPVFYKFFTILKSKRLAIAGNFPVFCSTSHRSSAEKQASSAIRFLVNPISYFAGITTERQGD